MDALHHASDSARSAASGGERPCAGANKAPLKDSITLQGSGVEDGDIIHLSYLAKSKAG